MPQSFDMGFGLKAANAALIVVMLLAATSVGLAPGQRLVNLYL